MIPSSYLFDNFRTAYAKSTLFSEERPPTPLNLLVSFATRNLSRVNRSGRSKRKHRCQVYLVPPSLGIPWTPSRVNSSTVSSVRLWCRTWSYCENEPDGIYGVVAPSRSTFLGHQTTGSSCTIFQTLNDWSWELLLSCATNLTSYDLRSARTINDWHRNV